MKSIKWSLLTLFFFCSHAIIAFDWQKFEGFTNEEKYKEAREVITKTKGDEIEKQLAEAVLLILESRTSHMALVEHEPNRSGSVGHLGAKTYFHPDKYVPGMKKLSQFIAAHPDRLDARNVRLQILLIADDFGAYQKSVEEFFERDSKNSHKWRVQNEKEGNPHKHSAIENVQRTLSGLFERDEPGTYETIQIVGNQMIQYFPEHIYGYNNVAVFYLLRNDFKAAIAPLESAHKIDPADEKVTRNLAIAYEQSGKVAVAKGLYEGLVKTGSEDTKEWAAARLKKMK